MSGWADQIEGKGGQKMILPKVTPEIEQNAEEVDDTVHAVEKVVQQQPQEEPVEEEEEEATTQEAEVAPEVLYKDDDIMYQAEHLVNIKRKELLRGEYTAEGALLSFAELDLLLRVVQIARSRTKQANTLYQQGLSLKKKAETFHKKLNKIHQTLVEEDVEHKEKD